MARTAQLTVIKDGINRLRPKGGARADSLYELTNAFVTAERTVVNRPGTRRLANLPAGTVGLVAFQELYHVFASAGVSLAAFPEFRLDILLHPFDQQAVLTEIHYASPFLGALYVVAEFDDAQIYHYWLQAGTPWTATTEIAANEFRTPTVPNGYVYRALRLGAPYPAWTPARPVTAAPPATIVEPTTYNEYFFTADATQGTNPTTSSVEPEWPTETGAQITESSDGFTFTDPNAANPPAPPAPTTPQASTTDRYEL
jgi:hypothetical protein